jgi:hypothetical protein
VSLSFRVNLWFWLRFDIPAPLSTFMLLFQYIRRFITGVPRTHPQISTNKSSPVFSLDKYMQLTYIAIVIMPYAYNPKKGHRPPFSLVGGEVKNPEVMILL